MSIFQTALDLSIEDFDLLLLRLRKAYYNDIPEITDEEYDSLIELYKNRFNKEYISVGSSVENIKKTIKLPRYMQSLEKIKDTDTKKFENWIKKYKGPYVISDKLDGISCGMWGEKTFTQGDGSIGVDISHLNDILGNKNIKGLPRGEIVVSKSVFNKKYKDTYSNPRNMVTGVVGRKTKREESGDLRFYAYNWCPVPDSDETPKTPLKQFKYLEKYFRVPFYEEVNELSIELLQKIYKKRKEEADYDIDGIVVYQNKWEDIVKGELVPKNAFAFKMDGEHATTTITKIEWEVSKHGKIKPVAHFNEVNLGVTISKSTAFSAKFVINNNLGPGSVITIVRSGEVIPYIKSVEKSTKAQLPDFPWTWCKTTEMTLVESCKTAPPNSSITIISGKEYYTWEKISDVDIEIVSDSTQTQKMQTQKIIHFFKTLKAKHVGEETISKLVELGYTTLQSILSLEKKDVLKVEGFKEKSSERFLNAVKSCIKDVDICLLVSATGIFGEGIGRRKFQSIIDVYPNFLEETREKSVYEIEKMIKSVGGFDKKAIVVASGMENLRTFLKEHPQITIQGTKKEEKATGELILEGKTIVFTGFRDETLENKIKSLGGKIGSSVSKNTSILVKKGTETSTKEVKAMNCGVEVYTLEKFMKEYIEEKKEKEEKKEEKIKKRKIIFEGIDF